MLGSDLVRARRRGERLTLQSLKGPEVERAREISTSLIECVNGSLGDTLEEVNESLAMVAREDREEKLWAGLKKLLLDQCDFGGQLSVDSPSLRREIFTRAAHRRQQADTAEAFDRESLLTEVATLHSISIDEIEQGLFSDLKGAQRLCRVPQISAERLVELYELAQVQGVLLKAVRLTVEVRCSSPDKYRQLFQKLKFRRLLYRLTSLEGGGYRLEIDGPFSIFESVTKYGLNLALIVPALRQCQQVSLEAEVKWGKERRPLLFQEKWLNHPTESELAVDGSLRSEVATLLTALQKKQTDYQITVSEDLLDIPGVGLCVPDLKFQLPGKAPIYLEVLGYWSREAVFRRIEWAQSEGSSKVIFCASTRLRVSRELLDDCSGSSLYIYKGAISPAAILAQLASLRVED